MNLGYMFQQEWEQVPLPEFEWHRHQKFR